MLSSKQKNELRKELKTCENAIANTKKTNCNLKNEIEDLKTTLKLNQQLCIQFLSSTFGNLDQEIISLFKENENLLLENERLIENNSKCEQKMALIKEQTEIAPSVLQNEIARLTSENDKLQNEIIKKDQEIQKLKIDLDKIRDKSLFKNARNEIYVVEPTSCNINVNHEIVANKIIIRDVYKMSKKEKEKNDLLDKEIEDLEQQIKSKKENKQGNKKAKRKGVKIPKKKPMGPIGIKTDIKGKKEESEEDGDNISFKSNENSEQESQEESEEDSEFDDDLDFLEDNKTKDKKGKTKSNKKIFDLICKEYNKLRAQNDELETRIQKYKNTYLNLRNQLLKYTEASGNQNAHKVVNEFSLQSTEEKTEDKK